MRLLLLLCAITSQVFFNSAVFGAVVGRAQVKAVVVNQTVTGPALGSVSRTTIDVGRIEVVRGSLAQTKGTNRAPSSTAIQFPKLDVVDYGSDLTDKEIREAANEIIVNRKATIALALSQLMKDNAATTGFYTFEQEVNIKEITGRNRLVWMLIVDSSGRAIAGETKIIKETQSFIYVSYTPRRVANGLQQDWQYPEAGILSWARVDSNMTPLGPMTKVDTGGFFDEPENPSGDEREVKCLVNKAVSGCSSPYPDVDTLMSQSSADGAFVDYVHPLRPEYDDVEIPPGSGNHVSKARVVFNISPREVSQVLDLQCKNPQYFYRNAGQYQFELNQSMTRYFVEPGRSGFTPIANMSSPSTSPMATYDLTMQVDEGLLAGLGDLFIDPSMEEEPLLSIGILPAQSTVSSIIFHPPPKCTPVPPPPSK